MLARHCEAEGRDPASIEKTIIPGLDALDDLDAFVASMETYAKLGIDKVWITPTGPDPAASIEHACARIVPRLAELGPA